MKDSGMSDSAFYKFQKQIQKKMKKFSADLDSELEQEAIKKRFERNSKPVQRNKTLWQKIKGWLSE
jgi:hypothetical protein